MRLAVALAALAVVAILNAMLVRADDEDYDGFGHGDYELEERKGKKPKLECNKKEKLVAVEKVIKVPKVTVFEHDHKKKKKRHRKKKKKHHCC